MSQMDGWKYLQRFAEGGDGGSGAGGEGNGTTTGETEASGNPGRDRLLELGVPAGKISKRAERAVGRRMDASKAAMAGTQVAAAEGTQPTEEVKEDNQEPAAKRLSWEEIKADPEYNAEIQKTIQARLRKAKGAEETLQQLGGAMEVLARKYGMDPGKMDYGQLAKAIEEDASLDAKFYDDMGKKLGMSPDAARIIDRQQREAERERQIQQATAAEQAMAQHFAKLEQQAEALKQAYPNFDLRTALQDERFARAVGPGGGLTVEQAYNAFHWKEIQAAQNEIVAKKLREEMARSIQSNQQRPQELGSSGAAPSVMDIDWSKATKEQLREMNERVRREGRVFR